MAVFRVEKKPELHGYVEPPPAQPGTVPKSKRASLTNALPARRMGLHPKGAFQNQP